MSDTEYRFTVRPLSEEEGGGYLVEYPDLPGCMSDGETIEEAIVDAEDAKRCWIAAMQATQSLSRWRARRFKIRSRSSAGSIRTKRATA